MRTQLAALVKKCFALALLSKKNPYQIPINELRALADTTIYSRRKFLVNTAKVGLGTMALGSCLTACKSKEKINKPKLNKNTQIAIIGAGIAGLNTAYQLQKAGYEATIYEASARNGGRILTAQNVLGENLSTELGGEFINSYHTDMLNLASEFELDLLDMQAPSEKQLVDTCWLFGNQVYEELDIIEAFQEIAPRIAKDYNSLSKQINYQKHRPTDIRLDRTSIAQYLKELGVKGWLYSLLDAVYTSEMGIDIGNQSALNFITFIGTDISNGFTPLGESDERYKIKGGNQLVIENLVQRLDNQIKNEYVLVALRPKDSGYQLSFQNGKEAKADVVVLALPFTKLRSVALNVDMPLHKRKAIYQLGYGQNAKLVMGFKQRIWRETGYTGSLYSDRLQCGWDNSRMQNQNQGEGGFTIFLGGQQAKNLIVSDVQRFLPAINAAFRGASGAFNGKSDIFNWPKYEWTQASYAAYLPSQWTGIKGAEIEPLGNVYFAGEHCSTDFQGYMNGGAETGRKVATAILAKLNPVMQQKIKGKIVERKS